MERLQQITTDRIQKKLTILVENWWRRLKIKYYGKDLMKTRIKEETLFMVRNVEVCSITNSTELAAKQVIFFKNLGKLKNRVFSPFSAFPAWWVIF